MAKKVDIPKLLERLDIKVSRSGSKLNAACPSPDHRDSSPSWRIIDDEDDDKHGNHRCYGCGFGGWPIHLVQEVLQCSRGEAQVWLRDITKAAPLPFNVTVDIRHTIPLQFKMPAGFIKAPLTQWPTDARAYAEQRVKWWQIDRWGLGYAIDGPLARRLVIPVCNSKGRAISYTGRSYNGSRLRYKEPGLVERADLGAVLGEQHWPKPRRRRVVVVTEGAFDAFACEAVHPDLPIGGIFGSQLQDGHVIRLSTFDYILMATDGDRAGNTVAAKLEEKLRRHSIVLRVPIPEGTDCAAMVPSQLKDALDSMLDVVRSDRDRTAL